MKTSLALAIIVVLGILACGKDKFQTVPQLKIKSKSTDVVPFNENLSIILEYTDKEGDVDDSLIIVRQRLNIKKPLTLAPSPYKIPTFPDTQKGEFEVNFRYTFDLTVGLIPIPIPGTNPQQNEPDTMVLKFVARDKAGNKSDTVATNVIVRRS